MMKKRLKENAMLIILCIVIICCTVSINNKIENLGDIRYKIDTVEMLIQNNGWKLDNISNDTNLLHNIEEWTHKIYIDI